jgi:hypothetical protein
MSAATLRDEGISRVLSNNIEWRERYKKAVAKLPLGEYTGEDVRLAIRRKIGEPSNPNAWGGAFNGLVRGAMPMFVGTKEYRAMKTDRSHARATRVYKKVR